VENTKIIIRQKKKKTVSYSVKLVSSEIGYVVYIRSTMMKYMKLLNTFKISFFFAIDTAAVLLTVEFKAFRFFDAFFPAYSEVLIKKGNPDFLSHRFADVSDHLMLLKSAV
jgi:hypothetical protein